MIYERRQNVGHKTAFVLFYRANLQASKIKVGSTTVTLIKTIVIPLGSNQTLPR